MKVATISPLGTFKDLIGSFVKVKAFGFDSDAIHTITYIGFRISAVGLCIANIKISDIDRMFEWKDLEIVGLASFNFIEPVTVKVGETIPIKFKGCSFNLSKLDFKIILYLDDKKIKEYDKLLGTVSDNIWSYSLVDTSLTAGTYSLRLSININGTYKEVLEKTNAYIINE